MASNSKTAKVVGSLLVAPSNSELPGINIPLDIYTGSFNVVQRIVFTLAITATKTITFSDFGILANAHFMYVKAKDVVTGLPRSVELTFTAPGGASGGIAAVNPSALVASDMIMSAYDLQDFTAIAIQAQSSGNSTEVTLLVGGS